MMVRDFAVWACQRMFWGRRACTLWDGPDNPGLSGNVRESRHTFLRHSGTLIVVMLPLVLAVSKLGVSRCENLAGAFRLRSGGQSGRVEVRLSEMCCLLSFISLAFSHISCLD